MFKDRADAGERLAEALKDQPAPLLLGLARGGLPVAASAARKLVADFDALVVRKVAPEDDREFGEGAVAPGGIEVGAAPRAEVEAAKREMARRVAAYLDGHPAPAAQGRLVVLVDDGLATGVTALAAIRYVRTLGPSRLVFAVPVLSKRALEAVSAEADAVVYLLCPDPFYRVEDAYATFPEVTGDEVRDLLDRRSSP